MSASTRLMAISDCVALDALRVGADLKGIAFISSQLLLLTEYHRLTNQQRSRNNSNSRPNAHIGDRRRRQNGDL
jgi:hypothetical protein